VARFSSATQQIDLADRPVCAGARQVYQPAQGRRHCPWQAQELIETSRGRLEKDGKPVRVVSIYEAGYDGFWLHRA